MPYEWVKELPDTPTESEGPLAELHLWPYRSLPRKGFVTFFAITSAFIALPLIAMIGSPVMWGLLQSPCSGKALALMSFPSELVFAKQTGALPGNPS